MLNYTQWGMQAVDGDPYEEAFAVAGSGSGSPVDVLPGVGQLTLTGFAPIVSTSVDVLPGVGQLTVTGYAPTIETPVDVAPGVGTLEAMGFSPTVSTPLDVLPGMGALAITGYAPSVTTTAAVVNPAKSPTQLVWVSAAPGFTCVDAHGHLIRGALFVKTGESGARQFQLVGADGVPEDLTGASGTVTVRRSGYPIIDKRAMTIVTAASGIASFAQSASDFTSGGFYDCEVSIVRANGSVGQFPEQGYGTIVVTQSLTQ